MISCMSTNRYPTKIPHKEDTITICVVYRPDGGLSDRYVCRGKGKWEESWEIFPGADFFGVNKGLLLLLTWQRYRMLRIIN